MMSSIVWTSSFIDRDTAQRRGTVQRNADQRNVIATAALVCGAVLSIVPADAFHNYDRNLIVWSTFALLVALAVIGNRLVRASGEITALAPLSLVFSYYCFRYGWGSIVTQYWHNYPWEVYPHFRLIFRRQAMWDSLPTACHLILLFGFGLFAGLAMKRSGWMLPPLTWRVASGKFKSNLILLAPLAGLGYSFIRGIFSLELQFSVGVLVSICYPWLIMSSYWLFVARTTSEKLRWVISVAATVICTMPAGLVSGQILPTLMPFLLVAFGYAMAKGRLPWKTLAIALPFAVLVAVPFAALYKISGRPGITIPERLEDTVARFEQTPTQGRIEIAMERILMRFAGSFMPSTFSYYYPHVYPYEMGRTFLIEASSFVPRVIWKEKPYMSYELNLYSERVGLLQRGTPTSVVFDAIAEYYANFGFPGTFLLAIVHGYYLSTLYYWLVRRSHHVIGSAVFISLVLMNEDFFGVGQQFVSHIKLIPVWVFLTYLISGSTGRMRHV